MKGPLFVRVECYLKSNAVRYGDKIALVAGGKRVSYAKLEAATDRLAHALSSRGVSRGDRVIICMDNSWEAVVGIFAALKSGAVFSPISASTKPSKLAYIIRHSRAVAILIEARLLPVITEALADCPSELLTIVAGGGDQMTIHGTMSMEEVLSQSSDVLPSIYAGIDVDLAMIIYTSGSTGLPKGVMMTHQNIVAAATSVTSYLQNRPDDIILSVLPISNSYGLYQVLMAITLGATLILEKTFTFPQSVFQRLADDHVTGFPLVPTMAAIILQMKDLRPRILPNLRYITNAGAALAPAHIKRLQELFPTAQIYSMYGLTECKRATWLPPEEILNLPTSVGIPIPGSEAYVVDDVGNRVASGMIGELVVRGPHVMKGYWEDQAGTDLALRPGPYPWEKVLYTGDLFREDEGGYLYFIGRKDDLIKTRGEKVSPLEVENILYELQGIREAAIVGVPDRILGMAIKAVVAVDPDVGLTAATIIRHCARHLEDFMVPKTVEFLDALPKLESGKISRRLVMAENRNVAR